MTAIPYIEKIQIAGKSMFVDRYHTPRINHKGCKRAEHKNPTKEEQEKVNMRKSIREITIEMNANFGGGDYHLVLTYRQKPEDLTETKKNIELFMRKMRRTCKKNNLVFKYIVCTEVGKRGALHHHLLINKMDLQLVMDAWEHGRVHVHPLDDTGEYSRLAAYFAKYKKQWKESNGPGRGWSCSQNLERPEPKIRIIKNRDTFYREPRAKKGYYIDKELTRSGYHEKTGQPFMSYVMIKLKDIEKEGRT